ncbi:MAG: galactose ABC transporter substrate-binding protein [Clostridiaceae bacterium]|nr:galactose ABC transporter substrate-binding protein [Clostridiaceae bacterium]
MKRILALLLTLVMMVGLVAACGGSDEPAETDAPEEAAEPADDSAEEEPADEEPADEEPAAGGEASDLNVGVFYYDFADSYISTVRSELDKMLEEAGITYTNYDAAGSQPTQTEAVNSAITGGTNLLVVNIVETAAIDAAQGIVDSAKEAGIPVIFFNREIDNSVIDSYELAAFVGTDAPEAGHMQGQMIGEFLLENYDDVDLNGDGKISYIMLKGQEGNPEAEARTQYSVEDANAILTDAGKEELVYYDENAASKFLVDPDGAWSSAAGQEYMQTALATYTEDSNNMIEIVIGNNDDMALGALSALQAAGYNKEGGTYIPVFGVDATETAVGKIDSGEMTGSIKQDNVGMASTLMTLINNVANGDEIMANTDDYNVDADVDKIRVPYSIVTGQ